MELSIALGHDPLWAHHLSPEALTMLYARGEMAARKARRKTAMNAAALARRAK